MTSRHSAPHSGAPGHRTLYAPPCTPSACEITSMGIDFHLISNFLALALITLAGPAVIFILFYRRGAL
ncbi:MAG: photosystem II reaction center protein Ycf12/Psb30 [Cyanobacteriota bacterium]